MKIILSIDGGGCRGAIPIKFLENLEKELKNPIRDYIDLFVGSSTGALIVCGISHSDLSCSFLSENLYTYEVMSKIMKKTPLSRLFDIFQTKPKFDGKEKTNIIKKFSGEKKFNETDIKTMVPLYDITENRTLMVKSWNSSQLKLSNIIDAASAAPGYFPSVEYTEGKWAIDSGVVSNNPSLSAYIEALKIYGTKEDIKIISIGTGNQSKKPEMGTTEKWGGIEWFAEGQLVDILSEAPSENESYLLKILTDIYGHQYIRINGHIDNIKLDDTSKEDIEKLKQIGNTLWNDHKKEILKIFNQKSSSLASS